MSNKQEEDPTQIQQVLYLCPKPHPGFILPGAIISKQTGLKHH